MKTIIATAAFLLTLCGSCQTSQAQSISLNSGDFFNDYELYLADPDTTNWYILWTMEDGSVLEEGVFNSHQGAQDRLTWYFLGGHERSNEAEIVELTKPPQWQYFGTFDTYAEVLEMETYFYYLGLLRDIRTVNDPDSIIMQRLYLNQPYVSPYVRATINRR